VTQMAAVNGTTGTQPTTGVVNNSSSAQLGENDFLKMLIAQLKNQDPTSPTDPTQWTSQLAQFTSLEQMTNVAQSMGRLVDSSSLTQGVDLIGKQLTWTRSDGSTGIGVVDGLTVSGGVPTLDVNGEAVTLDTITSVATAPGSSSGTSSGASSQTPSSSSQTSTSA
jgi:flagellar basal-body rod modification protein FlgD